MDMSPERSTRNLHNFELPSLRWANQRYLRCMKIDDDQDPSSLPPPTSPVHNRRPGKELITPRSFKKSPAKPILDDDDDDDDNIEAVREKVMLDLRLAADRIKDSIFDEKKHHGVPTAPHAVDPPTNPNSSSRPCSLRTRRAACNEPLVAVPAAVPPLPPPPPPPLPESPVGVAKSTRLRGLAAAVAATTATMSSLDVGGSSQRPKFSLTLSREEIESDFLAMTGKKPARRPKKRPRNLQKQMDLLYPGTWLREVTPDRYKVPDLPDSGN